MHIFNSTSPIYLQLCDYFKAQMLSGAILPGSKITSVRNLAVELEVNPNTMQKALSLLEEQGLMKSERTSGRFVTNDEQTIEKMRKEKTGELVNNYFSQMKKIGFENEQALKIINKKTNLGEESK